MALAALALLIALALVARARGPASLGDDPDRARGRSPRGRSGWGRPPGPPRAAGPRPRTVPDPLRRDRLRGSFAGTASSRLPSGSRTVARRGRGHSALPGQPRRGRSPQTRPVGSEGSVSVGRGLTPTGSASGLRVSVSGGGADQIVEVFPGRPTPVGDLRVGLEEYFPDFALDEQRQPYTRSCEPRNPGPSSSSRARRRASACSCSRRCPACTGWRRSTARSRCSRFSRGVAVEIDVSREPLALGALLGALVILAGVVLGGRTRDRGPRHPAVPGGGPASAAPARSRPAASWGPPGSSRCCRRRGRRAAGPSSCSPPEPPSSASPLALALAAAGAAVVALRPEASAPLAAAVAGLGVAAAADALGDAPGPPDLGSDPAAPPWSQGPCSPSPCFSSITRRSCPGPSGWGPATPVSFWPGWVWPWVWVWWPPSGASCCSAPGWRRRPRPPGGRGWRCWAWPRWWSGSGWPPPCSERSRWTRRSGPRPPDRSPSWSARGRLAVLLMETLEPASPAGGSRRAGSLATRVAAGLAVAAALAAGAESWWRDGAYATGLTAAAAAAALLGLAALEPGDRGSPGSGGPSCSWRCRGC